MKRKKVLLSGAIILCTIFGAGVATGAAVSKAEPGSVGDPIVTKSYVDQQIRQLQGTTGTTNSGNSSNNEGTSSELLVLQKQLQEMKKENEELKQQVTEAKFKKVTVKQGKTLVTKYGTEVFFYSGDAVWKPTNETYVVDQTAQAHVKNGTKATEFHQYLIRSGSNLIANKDSVVYVKGTYSIKTK